MEAALLRRIPYHRLALNCCCVDTCHVFLFLRHKWLDIGDVPPRTVASERWNCRDPQPKNVMSFWWPLEAGHFRKVPLFLAYPP